MTSSRGSTSSPRTRWCSWSASTTAVCATRVEDCSADTQQQLLDEATAQGVEVGPDVYVIEGDGLWTPPANVVADAQAAAAAEAQKFESHPGPLDNLPQNLLVVLLLALLLIVPGWLASNWLGIRSTPDRIALIPGMSVIFLILSGIGVLAVWRGPLSVTKGWTVVAVAIGLGAALRFADAWLRRPLESFGNFFNGLFGVFSNRDFAILMGVQFLVQAGQGVIQGAIGKSIAFGGKEGFDIQNVPSADYLLKVVLALYVPYTLLSPFIGVFIDRFARRRVVWWTNLITSAIVGVIAIVVLAPLGDGEVLQGARGTQHRHHLQVQAGRRRGRCAPAPGARRRCRAAALGAVGRHVVAVEAAEQVEVDQGQLVALVVVERHEVGHVAVRGKVHLDRPAGAAKGT